MVRHTIRALLFFLVAGSTWGLPDAAWAELPANRSASIIHRVTSANERLEMTVNTSRILSLERKIPQAQVNNPEILGLTPLSPTDIQLAAKRTGVTQVNLWDENNQIFTVDVIVYGDTRELSMLLAEHFPDASLKVRGIADGVLVSGYVDQPNDVSAIVGIAEQFYPQRVSTRLQVGGVQQVLLHVKVMEVSRTKLRALGFDWYYLSSSAQIASAAAGLLNSFDPGDGTTAPSVDASGANFHFNVVSGSSSFFGILEAMRQDNMARLLAEPTLVTVSGRPASFQSGGEVPVTTGGGLGVPANTVYKPYGTQVDFVPIVMGNGRIRLEVRPRVSEVDASRGLNNTPAFRVRQVDTGVEMEAGQTLAIAGLIQNRVESERRGLPWVSELPYVGVAFRHTREEMNEVELLILVTPELVEAMDGDQVPNCGPGMKTTSPCDWELYAKGHIEVPSCCSTCAGHGCTECMGSLPQEAAMPGMIGPMEVMPPGPQPSGQAPVLAPQPPTVDPPAAPSASAPDVRRLPPGSRAKPVKTASAPMPNSPNMTNRIPTTSQLPGLIGPVGYDAPQ